MTQYEEVTEHPLYPPLKQWVTDRLNLPDDARDSVVVEILDDIMREHGAPSLSLKTWEEEVGKENIMIRVRDVDGGDVLVERRDLHKVGETVDHE